MEYVNRGSKTEQYNENIFKAKPDIYTDANLILTKFSNNHKQKEKRKKMFEVAYYLSDGG